MITAPYGSWPSPISAADVAHATVGLSFPVAAQGSVWWQELRPAEGGRTTIMRDGAELLPRPWNARNRVHEYGGRSYLPVPGGFVFSNFADQRLYLVTGGEPQPLTEDNGDRYADTVLSPAGGEIWCVRERHADARITGAIVAVPLDPGGAVRELVTGADFFASPAPSPDGRHLAWISWNHPLMPWDGTELRVAPVDNLASATVIMGGEAESVQAPAWRDDDSLYLISDSSGWWNPYLAFLDGRPPRRLCPRAEEFAGPLWQLGGRPFELLGDGRLAVLHGHGEQRLGLLDPETGTLEDPDLPYLAYYGIAAEGATIAAIGGGPAEPWSVIRIDGSSPPRVLRQEESQVADRAWLPVPAQLTAKSSDIPNAEVVHALVYPPTSPTAKAPDGELPPFIVWVHGGPTYHSWAARDLVKAYFTSRGIGIIDVNYGGSTGYGRAYRQRLRGQWGIVDVADSVTAVLTLVAEGIADPKRLGIRGGSAGGWTALAAVTTGVAPGGPAAANGGSVFAAAVSYFGVSDLRRLAATTHDFESCYLDGLVGPLPEAEPLYNERSPIGHVSEATCPILLLQGLDDPVVPPAQSETIMADLASRGIPHAYLAFEGESHGFRKTESIITSLQAELSFYGKVMSFEVPGIPPIELA